MLNRKPLRFIAACSPLVFATQSMADSDWDYLAGISVGLRNIEFETSSRASEVFVVTTPPDARVIVNPARAQISYDETLYVAALSGTVVYNSFYLTAQLELTPQEEKTTLYTNVDPLPGPAEEIIIAGQADRKSELDRIDYNVTAGFDSGEGWILFGGYRYSRWDMEALEFVPLFQNKDQRYEEEGIFVGASYTLDFGQTGGLSFSVAYASLNAEFSESNVPSEHIEGQVFTFGEFSFDGTSTGLSYGVQWSGSVQENWVYHVGLKFQEYKLNNGTALLSSVGPGGLEFTPSVVTDLDATQRDSTFMVGLMYLID